MRRRLLACLICLVPALGSAQAAGDFVVVLGAGGCHAALAGDGSTDIVLTCEGADAVQLECTRRVAADVTPDAGREVVLTCDASPDADGLIAVVAGDALRAAFMRYGGTSVSVDARDIVPGDEGLRELIVYATGDDVSRVTVLTFREGVLRVRFLREFSTRMSAAQLRRAVRFPRAGVVFDGTVRLAWDAASSSFVPAPAAP